jgi:hypothetical protein
MGEVAIALNKFKAFVIELKLIQNSLAKPFPFIPEVEVQIEEEKESSDVSFALFGNRVVPKVFNMSKITDMVSSMGKSVRKYAETGFSRLTALPAKATTEELQHLTSVTTSVCVRCEGLERWVDFLESERMSQHLAATLPADQQGVWLLYVENCLFELASVSAFLMQVVCELLLRDVELLTARYMKRLRKDFTFLQDFPEEQDSADDRLKDMLQLT